MVGYENDCKPRVSSQWHSHHPSAGQAFLPMDSLLISQMSVPSWLCCSTPSWFCHMPKLLPQCFSLIGTQEVTGLMLLFNTPPPQYTLNKLQLLGKFFRVSAKIILQTICGMQTPVWKRLSYRILSCVSSRMFYKYGRVAVEALYLDVISRVQKVLCPSLEGESQ